MIAAKLLIPKKMRNGIHTIKKMKLILFVLHERFLNFSENIGISDTNSKEVINAKITVTNTNKPSFAWTTGKTEYPTEAQNKACAGTGKPINEVVCRSSILNLAKRKPENVGITNAR